MRILHFLWKSFVISKMMSLTRPALNMVQRRSFTHMTWVSGPPRNRVSLAEKVRLSLKFDVKTLKNMAGALFLIAAGSWSGSRQWNHVRTNVDYGTHPVLQAAQGRRVKKQRHSSCAFLVWTSRSPLSDNLILHLIWSPFIWRRTIFHNTNCIQIRRSMITTISRIATCLPLSSINNFQTWNEATLFHVY